MKNKINNNCIDCGREISHGHKRCPSYARKGKNNPAYKDGNTLKEYYCHCGNKISRRAVIYGNGECRDCWYKNPETLEKIGRNKNCIPWNKGLKGVQEGYWKGKSNKDVIVRHHIDGNHKNDKKSNILFLTTSQHKSLHCRGYEFIVSLGLVYDYLREFCLQHEILDWKDKADGKVVHHIDCKRSNDDESNFMYLKDRGIHNKLHQDENG